MGIYHEGLFNKFNIFNKNFGSSTKSWLRARDTSTTVQLRLEKESVKPMVFFPKITATSGQERSSIDLKKMQLDVDIEPNFRLMHI